MRSLLLLLTFSLAFLQIQAQGLSLDEETVDLETLYQQLDEAISRSPQYIAEREGKITACRESYLRETDQAQRLQMAEKLFRLYKPYRNDSALHYIEQCISLAESLRRPDLVGRYRSLLAFQCSNTDMNAESIEQLRLVDRSALDQKGLEDYYNAWMHVYGELASYTQRETMRQTYFDRQNLYRDSVMMVVSEGDDDWYHLKMDILSAQRQFQEALSVSNRWLKRVTDGTHESAYAAFFRSVCYDHLNNHKLAHYWLGKSALDDIQCAVMDQASLLFLAEHLANDGDLNRAERYLAFARTCNTTFRPQMRAYQFDPVVNVIEKSRDAGQTHSFPVLIIVGAILIFLLLLALILMIRKKRK